MGSRRTVLLLIGLGLGVVAAVLAWFYLSEADERAQEEVDTVEVVRAARDIPAGTTGEEAIDQGLVEQAEALEDEAPTDALTTFDPLANTVAAADIGQGQIVTSSNFVAPQEVEAGGGALADRLRADSDEASEELPEGEGIELQAVTISASGERGVAGLVAVGDRVNVMVFLGNTTRYMLSNMEVLAIGAQLGVPTGQAAEGEVPTGSGLFTLEATATQAARLAQATVGGAQIYLTLVPTDYDPGLEDPTLGTIAIDNDNLLG